MSENYLGIEKAVDYHPFAFESVPDCFKTQEMSSKIFNTHVYTSRILKGKKHPQIKLQCLQKV